MLRIVGTRRGLGKAAGRQRAGEPAMALDGTGAALELLSDSGVHPVDISSSLFDQLRWMSDAGHALVSGVKP